MIITTIANNKADSLKLRLIDAIVTQMEAKGWSQKEVAVLLNTTQPRISNLFNYHLEKFSLDTLFKYVYLLDIEVNIDIKIYGE